MTEISLDKLRERAREFEEEHREPIQAVVAVLIMVVTVFAAVAAFLETQAGSREAGADRSAQEYAIASLAASAGSGLDFSARYDIASQSSDLDWTRYFYSRQTKQTGDYADVVSHGYGTAKARLQGRLAGLFGTQYVGKSGFDYNKFYEEQQRLTTKPPEEQKAAALERGGWASKRGRYVTVITIFAVALFLLGLTLTVPPGARRPFLWMGSAVALGALIWGIVVVASSVPRPSQKAIDAFVDGSARADLAGIVGAQEKPKLLREAAASYTKAIEANPTYVDAYLRRGSAYFDLDLLENPNGPKGSIQSRNDYKRAVDLSPQDPVAWGNYGAELFWLADYEGALAAEQKAIELAPANPVNQLNLAEGYITTGHEAEYKQQLTVIRNLMIGLPTWRRDEAIGGFNDEVRLVLARPTIVKQVARFVDDIRTIGHQIEVSNKFYGTPVPPHTDAKVGAIRYEFVDRKHLKAHFTYTAVKPTDTWYSLTYVNGVKNTFLKFGPQSWQKAGFDSPDGGVVLTLPRTKGWQPGSEVRVEIFINGNLLSGSSYRIP